MSYSGVTPMIYQDPHNKRVEEISMDIVIKEILIATSNQVQCELLSFVNFVQWYQNLSYFLSFLT